MTATKPTIILTVRGNPIAWDGEKVTFKSGFTIDGDGSPRCYGPSNSGLDYTANAGHPGQWWGIVTDKLGNPIIQGKNDPYPGMYVSTTTYINRDCTGKPLPQSDPARYLDSERIPFGVIPSQLRGLLEPIFIGCRLVATNALTEKSVEAVIADIGPTTHLGEGSISLAYELGLNNNVKTGGIDEPIIRWTIYPGVAATVKGITYELQSM